MPQVLTLPFLLSFNDAVVGEFNKFLGAALTAYKPIAMEVPSITAENVYPRMNELRGVREWIGPRVANAITGGAFAIRNRTFENTLEVSRDEFEDDRYSFYTTVIQMMGQQTGELPDLLTFGLLKTGEAVNCYDGTPYFGVAHVSYDAAGNQVAYSNFQDAATPAQRGPAWYLFDTRRVLKPMIVQRRRPFEMRARLNLDDPRVFDNNTFTWGVDGRMNVGFGFYPLAFKSYAPLTAANYAAARAAMSSQHRVDGVPFGITPDILMHPPQLTGDARTLLKSEIVSMTSNPWKGTAEPIEVAWLA